jgi:hypothetical protein
LSQLAFLLTLRVGVCWARVRNLDGERVRLGISGRDMSLAPLRRGVRDGLEEDNLLLELPRCCFAGWRTNGPRTLSLATRFHLHGWSSADLDRQIVEGGACLGLALSGTISALMGAMPFSLSISERNEDDADVGHMMVVLVGLRCCVLESAKLCGLKN